MTPPDRSGPALDGDVDGDGRADTVSIPAPGTLRVRYATGTADTVAFDASAPHRRRARLLGIVDADQDGRAEVFVRAGSGASTDFAAVFRHVGGRLRLVTLDGRQAMLGYGAVLSDTPTRGDAGRRRLRSWQWSGQSTDGTSLPRDAALVPLLRRDPGRDRQPGADGVREPAGADRLRVDPRLNPHHDGPRRKLAGGRLAAERHLPVPGRRRLAGSVHRARRSS